MMPTPSHVWPQPSPPEGSALPPETSSRETRVEDGSIELSTSTPVCPSSATTVHSSTAVMSRSKWPAQAKRIALSCFGSILPGWSAQPATTQASHHRVVVGQKHQEKIATLRQLANCSHDWVGWRVLGLANLRRAQTPASSTQTTPSAVHIRVARGWYRAPRSCMTSSQAEL